MQKLSGNGVRQAFLDYFKKNGHTVVESSSLIPNNDPTLLFSNAGMNQFKDCFLGGEKRSYVRAATCQKCLRISGKHNDLENIGLTARHHTFFEMLGNFSFGDYFKAEAIQFGWEFVTKVLGLDRDRLWITIYEKDDEAAKLWADLTNVHKDRILRLGEKDNFWAMGETGPCGPCSEIHYYIGKNPGGQSEAEFKREDGSYLEIWNLVFMQFDRAVGGKLTPLPKPAIDTGAGLERVASVVQQVQSNYDTDLVRDVISEMERISGKTYDGRSYEVRDLRTDRAYATDVAMRVIADHSRAASFMIADGVNPGSDGRGYVLRRLIRRAVRHAKVLEFGDPFFAKACGKVISILGAQYPELVERKDIIMKLVDSEERKFYETLDSGLELLHQVREKLSTNQKFPGEKAFLLHDTYGFPLDLTEDVLKSYKVSVDISGFERAMEEQRSRSREDRSSKGLTFVTTKIDSAKTKFLGYETTRVQSNLTQVISDGGKDSFKAGEEVSLLFSATPFYAESGGQVGDSGEILLKNARVKVFDTQKLQNEYFVHRCEVVDGEVSVKQKGDSAELIVDAARREKIKANHSATHVVHAALRKFLGGHVKQAGSRVDERTLRFDYSHFEPLSEQQLIEIQEFANSELRSNYEVTTKVLPIEEAKMTGAVALFGEKYGEHVRVVEIGPNSIEFCGGTHVSRSGDIGLVLIGSETGVSAGVRRIECFSGVGAHNQLLKQRADRAKLIELLKGDESSLIENLERLIARNKSLERELESSRSKLASSSTEDLLRQLRTSSNGIKIIAERVDGADAKILREMVDQLRAKLGSGVVALGSQTNGSTIMVAGVTDDLTAKINAGTLVREAAKINGGKGGGKADFAQAGGGDPSKLGAALSRIVELV